MSLSPEVQAAVDEIRRTKNIQKAQAQSIKLMGDKIADLQSKVDAIPVRQELSAEDKEALQREVAELDALNDELEGAVPANTKETGGVTGGAVGGNPNVPDDEARRKAEEAAAERERIANMTPEEMAEDRGRQKEEGPRDMPGSDAQTSANGPSNHPAVEQAPLMPTLAFNPAGAGNPATPAGEGQPAQPAAIETAGGFVIQGGASTQRAPGSRPESPSSSLVVPTDPDAKAPVSTADEVKSGLGDSTGNEKIGNDLRPVDQGPGVPREPTDAEREAAQKLKEAQDAEMQRRRDNPLNLSPEDLEKKRAEESGQPAPKSEMDDTRAADGGEKRGE